MENVGPAALLSRFPVRASRKATVTVTLAALVVAAGAAVGAVALTQRGSALRCGRTVHYSGFQMKASGGPPFLGADPFGGTCVSLSRLAADHSWIRLPDLPLANAANVGGVWEYSSGAAIVYYSSGIELLYGGGLLDYTNVPAREIHRFGTARAIVEPAGSVSRFARLLLPLPGGHLVTLYTFHRLRKLIAVAERLVARS